MIKSIRARHLLLAVVCATVVGCSNVQPVAYSGIASSSFLKLDPEDKSGRAPYRFATQVDWQQYRNAIIDPVVVYRAADNQFGDMSDSDKKALAGYMQSKFEEKLRTRFELANAPDPSMLRVKLTLTGASTTTPFLGPFSRFDLSGGIYNVVQTARGKEDAFTGSVMYAVEIYDASNDKLLSAYVTKQYLNPYNLGASFGALNASKTSIEKGADALVAQLK